MFSSTDGPAAHGFANQTASVARHLAFGGSTRSRSHAQQRRGVRVPDRLRERDCARAGHPTRNSVGGAQSQLFKIHLAQMQQLRVSLADTRSSTQRTVRYVRRGAHARDISTIHTPASASQQVSCVGPGGRLYSGLHRGATNPAASRCWRGGEHVLTDHARHLATAPPSP